MINRRNCIKSLAGLFGAAAVVSANATEKPNKQTKKDEYDVVILGAGTGGLVTAIEAYDLGLKPIVLEKMDYAAGNSLYASGGIAAWGTAQQKAEGHEESEQSFREDMMKVSEYRADPELVDTYVKNIGKDLTWLKEHIGVKFAKIRRKPWPLNYRMHNVDGQGLTGGGRLIRYLLAACEQRNIPVVFNTKAMQLITNDDFRVVGIKCVTDNGVKDFYAVKSVVIATGGFSANREMLNRYMGGPLSRLVLRGSPYTQGENIKLTEPLGVKLVHMDQFHCGPIVEETHANPNFVIDCGLGIDVDVRGKRFMDEIFTYTQKSMATAQRTPENLAYHIIDSNWPQAASAAKKFIGMKTKVLVADSIEELAKKMGADPKAFVSLVNEFNTALKGGKLKEMDPPCSLPEAKPLDKAPYYAFPFQGGITATFGGPKINKFAQVVNTEDVPINGLYAVGNAAGGLFFGNYIGGTQLGGAIVFGRIAAQHMAGQK